MCRIDGSRGGGADAWRPANGKPTRRSAARAGMKKPTIACAAGRIRMNTGIGHVVASPHHAGMLGRLDRSKLHDALAFGAFACLAPNRGHAHGIAIHLQAARCQSKRVVTLPFRLRVAAAGPADPDRAAIAATFGRTGDLAKIVTVSGKSARREALAKTLQNGRPGVQHPRYFFRQPASRLRKCPVCRSSGVVRPWRHSVRPARRRPIWPNPAPRRGTARSPAA